jgi:RNA polymerase sigma-70 factor, ECF subfamily
LLFSIAYRMLGSVMDAEDVVQEAFVRWPRAPEGEVRPPKAYLSAVVTRLCIDRLSSARERREEYAGPWLPEPLPDERAPDAAETLALEESLSMAFLVLLESLTPVERAVFLLREVFDYDYSEVARIVGKEGANSCKHPILHGYPIPLVHRLKGNETVRVELSARRDH